MNQKCSGILQILNLHPYHPAFVLLVSRLRQISKVLPRCRKVTTGILNCFLGFFIKVFNDTILFKGLIEAELMLEQ